MDLFSEMGIMLNAKSYGMDLMNLIYSNGFKSTDFRHSPTIYQRVCHLIITVFGKLAWQSFNRIMSKNNWAEKLDYPNEYNWNDESEEKQFLKHIMFYKAPYSVLRRYTSLNHVRT
jgi:hypothetical protein